MKALKNPVWAVLIPLVAALSGCDHGEHMGYWPHMMDHPYGGSYMMWIWGIILLAVIGWLVWAAANGRPPFAGKEQDHRQILKNRYARGEITREDYERMKKELEE